MTDIGEVHALYLRGDMTACADGYYQLAREGDARAALCYGYCLWRGIGVSADAREAKSFFSFARELEGGDACYNLAVQYMHGDGVGVDYKKSIELMREAADKGCVEAQLYLGMVYTTGFVLEPDIIAINPIPFHTPEYRRADHLLYGDTPDLEREEDLRSFTVHADAAEAFAYFRMAAYHDPTYVSDLVAKGQFLYAKCFIDGFGTEYNRDKAMRLMLAAGKSGSEEAVQFLQESGISPQRLLDMVKRRDT